MAISDINFNVQVEINKPQEAQIPKIIGWFGAIAANIPSGYQLDKLP